MIYFHHLLHPSTHTHAKRAHPVAAPKLFSTSFHTNPELFSSCLCSQLSASSPPAVTVATAVAVAVVEVVAIIRRCKRRRWWLPTVRGEVAPSQLLYYYSFPRPTARVRTLSSRNLLARRCVSHLPLDSCSGGGERDLHAVFGDACAAPGTQHVLVQ